MNNDHESAHGSRQAGGELHQRALRQFPCNSTNRHATEQRTRGDHASAGLAGDKRAWAMKQERRTPGYTTCWDDMPVARA